MESNHRKTFFHLNFTNKDLLEKIRRERCNFFDTCNLDFEINLVKSQILPASNHQINHINIGGLRIPGQPAKFRNFWKGTIGVVLKNDKKDNSVYSLLYHLSVDFNKHNLQNDSGLDLSNIDERELVNYIFYNECLKVYNEELL